jgi:hypothetical protein
VKRALSSNLLDLEPGDESFCRAAKLDTPQASQEVPQVLPQACAIVVPVMASPPGAYSHGVRSTGDQHAFNPDVASVVPSPALLTAIPLLALGVALARRGLARPGSEEARATEAERKALEALLLQAQPGHYEE